ncbi:MAG: glycosyltransferase family 39 protein [Cyanobacteriota bacterium]|nr:glycosyltransferase family 39 protein [Cyanobacteriota bacterium]
MKTAIRTIGRDRQVDRFWLVGLLVAALILFGASLGNLPLRDWDEGTIAQVAREIWRSPPASLPWLYPTLNGAPYLNKPPLVHGLIALAYSIGGVNELTTRLPSALLTALSVPLLYTIGRELFPRRTPAIFAALVYLTLLPVVRHGRLAMLDGPALCFFLLMVLCVLRSRRNLHYALGVGISFGLICLTKGILGLLLGAIAIVFLAWDTPRLLGSLYAWLGVLIGCAPALGWCAAQWQYYGGEFIEIHLLAQSFDRIGSAVETNSGPPWYYLLELLEYSWPWLLFAIPGLRRIWRERNWGASKLILVWVAVYLTAISVMGTKLPWYVFPIYPVLALVAGVQLSEIWHTAAVTGMPDEVVKPYPRVWVGVLALLALGGWGATVYFTTVAVDRHFLVTLLAISVTMTFAGFLVVRRDAQFIPILFWGMYVSLLLFVTSDRWIWELNEDYPVPPVAEMMRSHVPPDRIVCTTHPHNRPSLNFYSDRQVMLADAPDSEPHCQNPAVSAYWLVQPTQTIPGDRILGEAVGWKLVIRDAREKLSPLEI